MKRFTTILAALLLSLTVLSAHRVVSAKDTWISVRSKNFVLIGNAGEKDVRQVAIRLEQFREVFTRLFPGMKFNTPVPTTVIVFKSDSSYRPFKPNASTVGYFQPGPDVNYITLSTELKGDQNPYNVIFHEYTHLLVNSTVGNAPSWFNEGLAEYYSSFSISNDSKVILGRPIANHVYLLRESKMLALPTLFQVDHKSPYYNERDKQTIFYAQSWALIHYLIHKPGASGSIDKFLKLMDDGKPMEQAFQEAFQSTYAKMEKELGAYIRRDSYPITNATFERKISFDTELQTSSVSEAEAQAYLGDLLLHSARAESESYLQRALALDPQQSMAHASLAMLRVREGKVDEARNSLERAVLANSQNYLIHYYYAFALSREGMNEGHLISGYSQENLAKMREELKKAIALRPDFPESYSLLAFINLVDGSNLDESIAMLKKVLATSPGRNDTAFMLVRVYMRAEDFKSARQLLERLSQNQSDPEVRDEAKNMLAGIAAQEENLARYRAATEGRNSSTGGSDTTPRLRRRSGASGTEEVSGVEVDTDPLSSLQEALRLPLEGEKQIQGILLRLDCDAKGILFVIQAGDRVIKVRTSRFENIQITSFTNDAGSEINCGPRKTLNPVVVCYQPVSDPKAKYDGELRSLEFVPNEFKLKIKA